MVVTTTQAAPALRNRVKVGDLSIDRVDLAEVHTRFLAAIEERKPLHVVTVNLQFLSLARRRPDFAKVVNNAGLVVADGMPLLWLSRLLRSRIPTRITGHDLLHRCAGLAESHGYSLFFLGATPEVAETAIQRLRAMYPGLRVAGTYQGRFSADGQAVSEAEEEKLREAIRQSRPDFLFVALGCPKQEFWIARYLHQIDVPVCLGIGGVLDVLAGRRKRAPEWIQRLGLEWLYRLQQEPNRLWKRYLLSDLPTACRLGGSALLRGMFQGRPDGDRRARGELQGPTAS